MITPLNNYEEFEDIAKTCDTDEELARFNLANWKMSSAAFKASGIADVNNKKFAILQK